MFDFNLSDDEMAAVGKLDKGKEGRIIAFKDEKGNERDVKHPYYPFSADF